VSAGSAPRATSPIGDDAAFALVEDVEGERHPLHELWRDQPVVLVFLRHFG